MRARQTLLPDRLLPSGWLLRRGHVDAAATRRFLNPKLSELSSPQPMADRALAAARLATAIFQWNVAVVRVGRASGEFHAPR